jgi:hypothetical protein
MSQVRAGVASLLVNGERKRVKGNASYNLGFIRREAIVGQDGVHGLKEMPQAPFIEVELSIAPDENISEILDVQEATVLLALRNGNVVELRQAWCDSEGTISLDEATLSVRFVGLSATEVGE